MPTQLDAWTKRSLESIPEEDEEDDDDHDLLDFLDFLDRLLVEGEDDAIFRRTGTPCFHLDVSFNMLIRAVQSLIRCPWCGLHSDRNIVQLSVWSTGNRCQG